MKIDEFENLFSDFTEQYHNAQNAYNLTRTHMLRDRVLIMDKKDFANILQDIAMRFDKPPPIYQIMSACLPLVNQAKERELEEKLSKLGSICRYCVNSGFVQATRKADGVKFAAGCPFCTCFNLRGLSRNIRMWNKSLHAAHFELWESKPDDGRPASKEKIARMWNEIRKATARAVINPAPGRGSRIAFESSSIGKGI